MNQPYIEFEGNIHPVTSIDWSINGSIYSVVFYPKGKYQMAFSSEGKGEEEGFDKYGLLTLNFGKRLKWSEPDA